MDHAANDLQVRSALVPEALHGWPVRPFRAFEPALAEFPAELWGSTDSTLHASNQQCDPLAQANGLKIQYLKPFAHKVPKMRESALLADMYVALCDQRQPSWQWKQHSVIRLVILLGAAKPQVDPVLNIRLSCSTRSRSTPANGGNFCRLTRCRL